MVLLPSPHHPTTRFRCVGSPLACILFSRGKPLQKNLREGGARSPPSVTVRGWDWHLNGARTAHPPPPRTRIPSASISKSNSKLFPPTSPTPNPSFSLPSPHSLPLWICFGWLPSPRFNLGGKPLQKIIFGGEGTKRTPILFQLNPTASQCNSRSLKLIYSSLSLLTLSIKTESSHIKPCPVLSFLLPLSPPTL